MEKIDISGLIKAISDVVKRHELPTKGAYARWLWQNAAHSRDLGINEYGCADAMNILYTIGEFECDEHTRAARIDALLSLQDPVSGLFTESTHHTIHTTAHVTGALRLFETSPRVSLYGLHKYIDKKSLYDFLENEVDWNNPWSESHKGAGIYAALVNAGELTADFAQNYFGWLYEHVDPKTGFWCSGYADRSPTDPIRSPNGMDNPDCLYAYMAASFHYLFNVEYAGQPIRYPERMIDSCIELYNGGLPACFGKELDFLEIDWIYCIARASRATDYRRDEIDALLCEFAENYISYLLSLDPITDDSFNDLHRLFGAVCALAELQRIMPDKIITERPLKLVLDVRPFI